MSSFQYCSYMTNGKRCVSLTTVKFSKNWDTKIVTRMVRKIKILGFTMWWWIQKMQMEQQKSLPWVCTVCSNLPVSIFSTYRVLLQYMPRKTTSETPCLLLFMMRPFQNGSTFKRKNLLLWKQILCCKSWPPFRGEAIRNMAELLSLKVYWFIYCSFSPMHDQNYRITLMDYWQKTQ